MIRRLPIAAALLALLPIVPMHADEAPGCKVHIVSSLALDLDDSGMMRIPVTLNHQPFKMLVDTGKAVSLVSWRTAQLLGLKQKAANIESWVLTSGSTLSVEFVNVEQFGFGGMESGKTQFMVDPSTRRSYDGLIGEDFLSNYDLDFDFAKGKLNIIRTENCTDGVVYWTKGKFGVVPFTVNRQRQIRMQVAIDGKPFGAILNTGSPDTLMNPDAASQLLPPGENVRSEAPLRTFKTLSFGDVTVNGPAISLSAKAGVMADSRDAPVILGMTILRRLHVYVSHKQSMVYVTPATQY